MTLPVPDKYSRMEIFAHLSGRHSILPLRGLTMMARHLAILSSI